MAADISELIQQMRAGDRRSLARLLSLVESGGSAAASVLAQLYGHSGRAHIIGVTGAPGTGKSSLVNVLAHSYRTLGQTVGILAIDPTSPFSGGALLGDRVRMRDLAGDAGVFVRSMATRGSLGGLSRATSDAVVVLDAAGFERVIIETVGVGQAEVDIASTAHTTIVVEAPGLGDEVQAIKAGILEIADILVVNKADRDGADRTVMALEAMLGLSSKSMHRGHHARSTQASETEEPIAEEYAAWQPPVLKTIATKGDGIIDLRDAIERHLGYLRNSGKWKAHERFRAARTVQTIIRNRLLEQVWAQTSNGILDDLVVEVAERRLDPYTAAEKLYNVLFDK